MPPKSVYWEFFEKLNTNEARCRACSKVLKTCGNTTNLKLHMEKMHSSLVIKNKNEVDREKSSPAKKPRKDIFKEPLVQASSSSAGLAKVSSSSVFEKVDDLDDSDCSLTLSDSYMPSSVRKSFQPTLNVSFRSVTEFAENGAKGIRLTNGILYMICKDSEPFQIVVNEGFKNLMKVAAPLYKIPSRYTFKRMLDARFQVTQNCFKDKIKGLNSITLTTDIWTDTMQTRSFIGITIHFYDEDAMVSATLGVYELTESHTAEYIARMLLLTCEEWLIDTTKLLAVVTDGGANIVKAIDIAFGKKVHVICFAHLLNLVAQKSIEKTEQLPSLIACIKKIVTWFRQSVAASDELRKQSDLKLIQDVATHWNSTFYMVERFLKLRPAINQIINCHTSAPPMVNAKQIEELAEICEILRPLEVATKEACGESFVTSSKVIPLTRMLNLKITGLRPKHVIGENLKENILSEIKKRLLPSEYVNILAISTLLDPRFKNYHFQDPVACAKVIRNVKELLTTAELQVTEKESRDEDNSQGDDQKEEFNLWSDHYKLALEKNCVPTQSEVDMPSELSYFLKNPLTDLKPDPIQVWNTVIGSTYPNLKKLAVRYLRTIATSTPSERLFSKAGSTLFQQRNRLKGSALSKLLFLQSIDKKYWNL